MKLGQGKGEEMSVRNTIEATSTGSCFYIENNGERKIKNRMPRLHAWVTRRTAKSLTKIRTHKKSRF